MAIPHGKRTKVYVDDADLSAWFRDAGTPATADTAETSGFGSNDKTYVVGVSDARITLAGMFDGAANAVDQRLAALLGADPDVLFTIVYGGPAVGNRGRIIAAKETSYEVDTPIGDVVGISVEAQANGGLDAVVALADSTAAIPIGGLVGAAVDNLVGTANGGVAHLHLIQNSYAGGTGVVVKVQHATASGGPWTDLITFTTIAAGSTGKQRVEIAGTVNEFLRANVATGGAASGTSQAALVFGRR